MSITHVNALRNTLADAAVAQLDSGNLVLMEASDTAVATLTFSSDAYVAATSGVAVSNAINDDPSAVGGVLALFKVEGSASTEQWRGTITASAGGGDMVTTGTTLTVGPGDTVQCTSLNYEAPA